MGQAKTAAEPVIRSLDQFVADIVRAERSGSSAVRQALRARAAKTGRTELELAEDWASYQPRRPVGVAVANTTSETFLPELQRSRSQAPQPLTRRLNQLLEDAKAEEILADSVCSLATEAYDSGKLPSLQDIGFKVLLTAFGENLPQVRIQNTVNEISEIFTEARGGDLSSLRVWLLQRRYC